MAGKAGIVMPVANEEASIGPFLEAMLRETASIGGSGFTVYVIMDDFSKDRTAEIVRGISGKNPTIRLVYFKESTGVVSCYLKGFKCALEDGCDYIIEMDSGGSHPPSKLRPIIEALDKDGYDVVFMSRFMRGAGIENFPLYRRIVSQGGTFLANLWLGMRYSDSTSGFEAFRAGVLRRMNLDNFISRGGIYQTEMKYYCHCLGCKAMEIPFLYVGTTSAFRMKWITGALKTLFMMRGNRKRVLGQS